MSNLMTKIYIGYVEEIIYKDGKPTLELRVRIPSIHGTNSSNGLKAKDLPIAKPIFTPGLVYSTDALIESLQKINKVFIFFESGSLQNPIYFGVKGNEELYTVPSDIATGKQGNITFAQVEDPTISNNVSEGDLWFDTSTE